MKRDNLSKGGRADHLAVLSFVAEAEGVATQALRAYIPEDAIMASTLYQEILAKGEARGETRGEARARKEALIHILTRRLGGLEPTVRERIEALESTETLRRWHEEALDVVTPRAARKLLEKITKGSIS